MWLAITRKYLRKYMEFNGVETLSTFLNGSIKDLESEDYEIYKVKGCI